MDLASLNLGAAPAVKADVASMLDFAPVQENGEPFLNGADEPLHITFRDPSGLDGKRELGKLDVLYPDPVFANPQNPTEEEAGIAAERRQMRSRQLFLRMISGWNLVSGVDGEPVPYTIDHGLQACDLWPSLAEAIAKHGVALLAAVGNARAVSRSGPSRTAGQARPSTRKRKAAKGG